MHKIEQIIVPVDFHQHTDDLAAFAIVIAHKLGCRLTFLHVAADMALMGRYAEEYPTAFAAVDEEILGYAQKKMDALVERNTLDCPGCTGVVLKGEAVDGIVDYVRDKENGLIVMGTHGAKGIEKILLGSVAERVLKRAACPILVFNPYRGDRGYQITAPLNETLQPV
ncbi:universal stress protein [Desulfobulbus elongatus]|uniref:universal stress protein n=1 Tax=Desulfobulbus elongatus TaxID=53332 RepID=UPI000686B6CA|nr:universal stress protein [Desulfobulbus elongatus]